MRTRRSQKSFGSPPKKRSRAKNMRKALDVVNDNETIVLSDSSDSDCEVVLAEEDEIDIQVVDTTEASTVVMQPVLKIENNVQDDAICNTKGLECHQDPITTTACACSGDIKSETCTIAGSSVGNVGEEDNPVVIDDEDDDDVEIVAVVVGSKKNPTLASSPKKRKRSSIIHNDRKSNNGYFMMQGAIKKAKMMVRRSSIMSGGSGSHMTNFSPVLRWKENGLNRISSNSKKIRRTTVEKHRGWANNFNRGRGRGARYFYSRPAGDFNRNRTKEYNRKIILRPETGFAPPVNVNILNPSNFSFEANPFQPSAASTPLPGCSRPPAQPVPVVKRRSPIAPGSNVMNVGGAAARPPGGLRPIVIDGSNVAVGHGGVLSTTGPKARFSARGLKVCVDYFLKRGHKEVFAFVPRFRLKKSECLDPEVLEEMERAGNVRFTPSRDVGNQRIASYDDLFVVQYADETGGIVISNDNFKDLYDRSPQWRDTIKFRLLQYTWITPDIIMFPHDPLGRNGPSLDDFLRF